MNTKCNIPSECDRTRSTKSVSAPSHQSAQWLDVTGEGYWPVNNTFNVVTSGQNQFWIDSTSTRNHESFFTHASAFPRLEEQGRAYKTEESACKQIDSWTSTLAQLPCEAGSIYTSPWEIFNETENEIMSDCLSFTSSSGINTPCGASHSYSNAVDCSPTAYTTHLRQISILEDYGSLHENITNQSWPPLNSRSQVTEPAIIWTDADQYSNDQAQAEDHCNALVNLRYDEVDLGLPPNINIDKQEISCQFSHMGGVQLSDRQDCSKIPNEGPLQFDCEREAGQATVWVQEDDPLYSINTDHTTASSFVYRFYF